MPSMKLILTIAVVSALTQVGMAHLAAKRAG